MKIEELPGIVAALFIPSSPSPNLGFAWDIMTALVAGACNVPNALVIPFRFDLVHAAA